MAYIDIFKLKIYMLKEVIILIYVSELLDFLNDKFSKVYSKFSIYFKIFNHIQFSVKE